MARLLGWCAFPWGRSFAIPCDRQGQLLARLLLEPSATRDRLTSGIFVPADPQQTMGRIEDALRKVIAAEPVEKALSDAIKKGHIQGYDIEQQIQHALKAGVITGSQVDILRAAHAARRAVIQVDDFAPEYLSRL